MELRVLNSNHNSRSRSHLSLRAYLTVAPRAVNNMVILGFFPRFHSVLLTAHVAVIGRELQKVSEFKNKTPGDFNK